MSNDCYNDVVVKHIENLRFRQELENSATHLITKTPLPVHWPAREHACLFFSNRWCFQRAVRSPDSSCYKPKKQFQSCAALPEMALPGSPLCCSVEELEHGAQWWQNVTKRPGASSKALLGAHPSIAEQRLKATFNFPGVEFGIVIPTQRAGSKLYEIVEYVKASCEDLIQIISQWYNDGLG